MKLVVATNNRHKLGELRQMAAGLPLEVVALAEVAPGFEVAEDGATFEENAAKKARETAVRAGLLALADDSGLEVDALGGAPGVRSARFAGEPCDDARNNALLLERLAGVPGALRTARYVCVVALARPEGGPIELARGTCEGRIGHAPRGQGGFGYDPYFVLPDGRHMAELAAEEKNRISHRGAAFAGVRALLERLC